MKKYVLDAWAVLSFLQGEPEGKTVQHLFRLAEEGKAKIWISWINVAEIHYITFRKATGDKVIAALQALNTVSRLPMTIVPAGVQESLFVGALKGVVAIGIGDAY